MSRELGRKKLAMLMMKSHGCIYHMFLVRTNIIAAIYIKYAENRKSAAIVPK